MDENKYRLNSDISAEIMHPGEEEVEFYLEEMQSMNNRMIDLQRELNRALMESKRMQEELKHSDELKKALEAAEKAGKAKMDFMSRMSHDLRTPMNVIMGLTAATLDDADDPKAVRLNMANIRSASDYMLGLVNDILDMAKAEKGEMKFKPQRYSYSEFLLEMRTMFQAQCDAKNIHLVSKEASFDSAVMVDKMRLKQIIFNIISNAVKYTPSGGTISVGAYDVDIDEKKKQLSAVYRVQDNGIGMSEEYQKHLFEPFVQEDCTVSPELQGSGLGLSITQKLVEQMGGSIQVESTKGKGTTVSIKLSFELAPPETAAEVNEAGQTENSYSNLYGKNILLAEDHPLNAMIARKLLEKKRMTVIHGESGKAALELFRASPTGSLDAVLMDIRMPEMSGLEAAKAIRALDRPDAELVPIIALSANAYPADVEASLSAGMNAHIAKPIEAATLYKTLSEWLV